MTKEEALQAIARYLRGERVPLDLLKRACREVQGYEALLERLCDVTGIDAEWVEACEAFHENLAEFCDLPRVERENAMPEMAAHMRRCPACLSSFYEVHGCWESEREDARDQANVTQVRLAWELECVIGESDRMAVGEAELAPAEPDLIPEMAPPPVLVRSAGMGPPTGPPAGARSEWTLPDGEAGLNLSVVAERGEGGSTKLSFRVEDENGMAPPGALDLRARDAETGAKVPARDLGEYDGTLEEKKLTLAEGEWEISIRLRSGEQLRSWTIPVITRWRRTEPGRPAGPREDPE